MPACHCYYPSDGCIQMGSERGQVNVCGTCAAQSHVKTVSTTVTASETKRATAEGTVSHVPEADHHL